MSGELNKHFWKNITKKNKVAPVHKTDFMLDDSTVTRLVLFYI